MKRIMIIGGSGSGKSTLARRLGEITGLPVVHIDPMFYTAGWVQRPRELTITMVRDAIAKESWVFDGNLSSEIPNRLARCDVFIFIDISTPKRLWRVLTRIWKYRGRPRPDSADGCPERFDWGFIKWVAGYNKNGRVKAVVALGQAKKSRLWYHIRTEDDLRVLYHDAANFSSR